MAIKFYSAENVGSRLIAGERFEVVEIFGGTTLGVFAARTDAQQVALAKLAADPASGVVEISEADYDADIKKKHPSLSTWQTSNKSPQVSIKGVGAVVVDGPPEVRIDGPTLETVESALDLGKVEEEAAPAEAPAVKPKAAKPKVNAPANAD